MYIVRSINGPTSFSIGEFKKDLGFSVKYNDEFTQSNRYTDLFNNSILGGERKNLKKNAFYKSIISKLSIGENTKCFKCNLCVHPKLSNNGGGHCCKSCKNGSGHGWACLKRPFHSYLVDLSTPPFP